MLPGEARGIATGFGRRGGTGQKNDKGSIIGRKRPFHIGNTPHLRKNAYLCSTKTIDIMNIAMPIEAIYEQLSSLSLDNKKWLADHLIEDVAAQYKPRTKAEVLSDLESALLDAKEFAAGKPSSFEPAELLFDKL